MDDLQNYGTARGWRLGTPEGEGRASFIEFHFVIKSEITQSHVRGQKLSAVHE